MARHKVSGAHARLAVIESRHRHAADPSLLRAYHASAWGLVVVGCLPWLVCGNCMPSWSWLLVAMAAASPWLPWLRRHALPLGLALCAYGGAASATWQPGLLGLAWVVAAAASLLEAPRRVRMGACAATAVSLFAVLIVLERSSWAAEAQRFAMLCTGLGMGAGVWMSGRALAVHRHHPTGWMLLVAGLGLAAGARSQLWPGNPYGRLPAWHAALSALPERPEVPPGEVTLQQLEHLSRAGSRAAAHAWVQAAAEQGADLATLRGVCPRQGWSGGLPSGWQGTLVEGEALCTLLQRGPRVAGAPLASDSPASRWRVQGDLWLEEGAPGPALQAFERATAGGDVYAPRHAVQLLLHSGQSADAWQAAAAHDGLLAYMLGAPASAATWQGYNAALDVSSLAAPVWHGWAPADPRARLRSLFDPELQRRIAVAQGAAGDMAGFALPLPPQGAMPTAWTLRFKAHTSFSVALLTSAGESAVYACGAPEGTAPLPSDACNGAWHTVELRPTLQGQLQRLELRGFFSLAQITATPSPAGAAL